MKKVELVEFNEWMKTGETELSKLAKEANKKIEEGITRSVDLVELRNQAKINIEKKKIKKIAKEFIDITKNSH
ncbi:MAG: hypothetical protein II309_09270 [Bacilli bacterium]|nr:hypothetical protein [Bacilli bacterium]